MQSTSTTFRGIFRVGANASAGEQARLGNPLKALLRVLRQLADASADAKQMAAHAHEQRPAKGE